MHAHALEILYEDNHLLAVVKRAGLATMGLGPGHPTLLGEAKKYVKHRYQKPGNVYLGVVSRLDAPVTGVVLFARTSKAASRLNEQFRNRQVEKVYWALVKGAIRPESGKCVDWLAHDPRHRRVHSVAATEAGVKEARLRYRKLGAYGPHSLLEVLPETGRKHQIRVQLASRGYPILGDRKYGSRTVFPEGIALHARALVVGHPISKEPVAIEAPLPKSFGAFGVVG